MTYYQQSTREGALRALYSRAAALIDGFSAELPPYATLPASLVEADFVRGVRLNVDLFFRFLIRGVEPSEADTAELVELAMTRLRDGVPLDDVLTHYRLGASMVWSQLTASASEAERALLLDAALPLMQYLSIATARIAISCVARTHDPRWEQLERRRGVVDALLAGTDPGQWAHDPDIPVADSFLVAVFRFGIAGQSAIGDLRNRITELPGAFLRLDGGGATALIPLEPDDDGTTTDATLQSHLALPAGIWVGQAPAPTRADVPSAFHEARVLAELGRCLSLSDVVCRRRALLFEYTVAVSGEARDRLAQALDPLAAQPVLNHTLEVYLDNDANQLATARKLNVHRNTITYRLSRIGELTGFDPQRPTDAMTLSAARLARRLTAAGFTV